jgi:hypothetical protein
MLRSNNIFLFHHMASTVKNVSMRMEVGRSSNSKTSVFYHNTTRRHSPKDLYLNFTAAKTSNISSVVSTSEMAVEREVKSVCLIKYHIMKTYIM